jgi:hypothetical protein
VPKTEGINLLDNIASDGMNLAKAGAGLLVGLGGVVAGIALASTDISFGLVDEILGSLGVNNTYLAMAIQIIGVVGLFAVSMWARGLVSNVILKAVFAFLGVMLGTYLVVKVVRMVVGLIQTGQIAETGVGGA